MLRSATEFLFIPLFLKTMCRFFILLVCFASFAFCHAEGRTEDRFLNALLERGLFRLAQRHCEEQLATENLSPREVSAWTVEFLRVLSERALLTTGEKQEELWQKAEKIYQEQRTVEAESPWVVLLDYQWCVGQLARVQQKVLMAKSDADSTKMEAARELLRPCITLLEKMTQTLDNIPADAELRPQAEGGPTVWQWVALQNQVRFQLLQAFKTQGETYPPQSVDRMNSLQQALQQIPFLQGLPSDSPLVWSVRLAEIACYRLIGDAEQARKRVEMLELHPLPHQVELHLDAEKILLFILEGDLRGGLEFIGSKLPREIFGECGDLDCAILELHLALWAKALTEKKTADAEKWNQESLGVLEAIRKHDSPWWILEAEIRFQNMLTTVETEGNLTILKLRAAAMCRSGDLEKALPACEALWNQAVQEKDAPSAVACGSMFASLAYREKKVSLAMEWFRKTAVTFPQEADALKNHHHALALAAQQVQEAIPQAQIQENAAALETVLDTYEAVLIEHVQLFLKKDPEILDVLQRLEGLMRIRKKTSATVDVAMVRAAQTTPQTPEHAEAMSSALDAWDVYLRELASTGSEKLENAILSLIRWSETQTLTPAQTLKVVEWQLDYQPKSAEQAAKTLEKMLQNSSLNAEERVAAQCFWVLATVLQGKSAEVAPLLQSISRSEASPTATVLAIYRTLRNLREKSPTDESKKTLATLELDVFEILKKDEASFSEEQRNEIERQAAEALLISGNRAEAWAYYERMATRFPNRRDVQTTWGELLFEEGLRTKERTTLEKAMQQWREIEKRTKNQSLDWFEAKYRIASLYMALGERTQAEKMIKTLSVLYPNLGGTEMKKKFQNLFQKENRD